MVDTYISVDTEASGRSPKKYSLLSIGACVVGNPSQNFYAELKPRTRDFEAKALEISGFDLDALSKTGTDPYEAMRSFRNWIMSVSQETRPIFVGLNAAFDWAYVLDYFDSYLGEDEKNPFGVSPLDIKSYGMGRFPEIKNWGKTAGRELAKKVGVTFKGKEHHALDDAIFQAEIFQRIRTHNPNYQ